MPKAKTMSTKPMKLQVNTAGAWKDVISFDGAEDHVTSEVMEHVHYLGIHDNGPSTFRIVATDPQIGVLANWSPKHGWRTGHAAH